MYNKLKLSILFLMAGIVLFSCGNEIEYKGDELINYPDLNEILADKWDMDAPLVYTRVSRTMSNADSSQIQSTDMPWQKIKDIFGEANIQKEELNRHYAIDILNDSISGTLTLYYKTLAPNDFTRSISIVQDGAESSMNSLYFETVGQGEDSSKTSKVLFIPNKLFQIQERNAGAILVDTYYFPE